MIKIDDKTAIAYNDDYKPVNIMKDGIKVAGYKEEQYSGKTIEVEDTYNDLLDCKVKGHHEQDSRKAYWWNQTIKLIGINSVQYCNVEQKNNDYICTVVKDTDPRYIMLFSNSIYGKILNHKYLFCLDYTSPKENQIRFAYSTNKDYDTNIYQDIKKGKNKLIFVFTNMFSNRNAIYLNEKHTLAVDDVFTLSNLMLIDLTAMFGEGKEPTAEQFRKMFPCDYYPYCAGEWRYANGGQYVNFNQLCNHNIKGTVNGVSFNFINNKIILNGTCNKTGNIYVWDMANQTNNKHKYLSICYGADSTKAWISKNSEIKYVNTIGSFAFNYCIRCIEGAVFNDFELSTLLIDLTQMFGEGNEPTTVEEFKALYPNEYYDYVESRYEYTPGYYEDGQVVEHIPDTAFDTPFPEMPEEIRCVSDAKVDVSSKGVVWNQRISLINGNTTNVGINYDVINEGKQLRVYGTASAGSQKVLSIYTHLPNLYTTHKYLIDGGFTTKNCWWQITYYDTDTHMSGIRNKGIFSPAKDHSFINSFLYISSGVTVDEIITPQLFDLTTMFGAGNEPQTIEEFRRLFPKDYYPYDAGTLRTVKGLHPIIPKDYTIPFELYGANGINDEVEPCVLVDGEWKCRVTRRWGKIDLGTLNWLYTSNINGTRYNKGFIGIINNVKNTNTASKFGNYVCTHYIQVSANTASFNKVDKMFFIYNASKRIYIIDNDETNTNDFKNKLNKVYFYYELETPTIELYPPIPIRTLPINTIINSDAELDCNIKVIDNS